MLGSRFQEGEEPAGESPRAVPADHGHALRLESESALTTLRELMTSGELEKGRANIIALDAFADRLGERWASHREMVYHQTERALYRHLGGQCDYERVSPLKYLLIHRGADRATAQPACVAVLRQVVNHFFGAAREGELDFFEVNGVASKTVFVARVEGARVAVRGADQSHVPDRRLIVDDDRAPFTVAGGRRVRVACALDPVYQIRSPQRIGYHISRWVLEMPFERRLTAEDQRSLTRADMERIDFIALRRGLDSLSIASDEREPAVILPVSYTTLSNHRTRADLIDIFREAQTHVRHGVIGEICNIEGVPASALLAACSPLRPLCRFIVANFESRPRGADLAAIKEASLQGVSIDFPWADAPDGEFITWMRTFMASVRTVAKTAIVYQMDAMRHAAMAAMMGVSHASIRPSTPSYGEADVTAYPRRRQVDETEEQMRHWVSREFIDGRG